MVGMHLGFPVAQAVKNLPAMWETWVQIPGLEDPMRRPWQPLHYSCLENPHGQRSMVGTVHMVAKSRTQLSTAQHVQLDGYY